MANTNIKTVIPKWSKYILPNDVLLLGLEGPIHFTNCTTIEDLMLELKLVSSKSEARRMGRQGPIPVGFTEGFKATKICRFDIWCPTE